MNNATTTAILNGETAAKIAPAQGLISSQAGTVTPTVHIAPKPQPKPKPKPDAAKLQRGRAAAKQSAERQRLKDAGTITLVTDAGTFDVRKGKVAKDANLTMPVKDAKGNTLQYFHPGNLKTLCSFIGTLCNLFSCAVTVYPLWPLTSRPFVIPAASGKGPKERSYAAFLALNKVMTAGIERTDKVPADYLTILKSFEAKGWKFKTPEGLKIETAGGIETVFTARRKEATAGYKFIKAVASKEPDTARCLLNADAYNTAAKLINDGNVQKAIADAKAKNVTLPGMK